MSDHRTINHDPHEPPPDRSGNGVYWAAFALLAAFWALALFLFDLDKLSLLLGACSGGAVCIWAMDITKGRLPSWWQR